LFSTIAAKKLGLSLLLLSCLAAAQSTVPDPAANSTLPVHTLRGYLMIVGVTINDRGPFDFLIDTGTNTTLLDPQLACSPRTGYSLPVSPTLPACHAIFCRR
jgi:hypothetical protein